MSGIESRKPFLIIPSEQEKDVMVLNKPFYFYHSEDVEVECRVLKQIDSDLLIAIDKNDVKTVKACLEKDHLSADTLYVIPSWEIPEAIGYTVQPLFHRAVFAGSFQVCEELLKSGADPKRVGYLTTTGIEEVFDQISDDKELKKWGRMLIQAGVSAKDIKAASVYRKSAQVIQKELVALAEKKEKTALLQELKSLGLKKAKAKELPPEEEKMLKRLQQWAVRQLKSYHQAEEKSKKATASPKNAILYALGRMIKNQHVR